MKKQILTLTLCLALTSATIVAGVAKTTKSTKSSTTTSKTTHSKKPHKRLTKAEAKKMFEKKMAQERQKLYKELKLTDEQIKKAEALDLKTRQNAGKVISEYHKEFIQLKKLEKSKAFKFTIWKQKRKVKVARNNINKYFEQSKKDFEALLTKEQKVKFQEIDKKRKEEMEKFKKEHKHGHHGSHGHMGPPPEGDHGHMGPPPPPEG